MFLYYCILVMSMPWVYQMLSMSFKPRTDRADVYRLPFGPMVMGVIFALAMWVTLVLVPFSIFGVNLAFGRSLWEMFLITSEFSMVFFYWKPLVNWIRAINGLPVGVFYEYTHWWA